MSDGNNRSLSDVTFRKSSRSSGTGNCVMLGTTGGDVLVQDSKEGGDQRTRTTLGFGRSQFTNFIETVKARSLDPR